MYASNFIFMVGGELPPTDILIKKGLYTKLLSAKWPQLALNYQGAIDGKENKDQKLKVG